MEVGGNFKVEDLVPTIGRSKKERNEKVKKKVRKKGVECDYVVGGDGGEAVLQYTASAVVASLRDEAVVNRGQGRVQARAVGRLMHSSSRHSSSRHSSSRHSSSRHRIHEETA